MLVDLKIFELNTSSVFLHYLKIIHALYIHYLKLIFIFNDETWKTNVLVP